MHASASRDALAIRAVNGNRKGVQHVKQRNAVNESVQHIHVPHCSSNRTIKDLVHAQISHAHLDY